MLTNTATLVKRSNLLLPLLLLLLLESRGAAGATFTWGQVNKYASTLYAQDVYLGADADVNVMEVAYDSQNSAGSDGYTITAVHAYDMTPLELNGGDGGTVLLLSGGVGQQHATVRFQRHRSVDQLEEVHFQLVIYGVEL